MSANLKGVSTAKTSDVEEQLAVLRDDIRALTLTVGDIAKAKKAEMTEAAKKTVSDASGAVNEGVETAKLRAMMVSDEANEFIRARPATALGIAAGLGFLVGMLGSRK
jgi:ElaB/YqjD/DUF883 family membrane-anchored ribosome-binding protein